MLNPFPELLALSFYAPFFLRIIFGFVLFSTSFHQLVDRKNDTIRSFASVWPKHGGHIVWIIGITEVVVGLSFIAGFYVQYAAIVGIALSLFGIVSQKYRKATYRDKTFYMLMFGISLSLLVTGAGIFAYDIPL